MIDLDPQATADLSDEFIGQVVAQFARRDISLPSLNTTAAELRDMVSRPDVGKPVAYKVLCELARDLDQTLSPETMGCLLAETWRLPEPVSVAIGFHHEYQLAQEHAEAAMIANLADQLACWCLHPESRADMSFRELPVITDLGLEPSELGVLFADPGDAREAAAAFA
jgi:HD-like signal output (HDOD) protein